MNLLIIKVNETLFEGKAEKVTIPAITGEITVMSGHEPLVTPLKSGKVTYVLENGESTEVEIERGFLEINSDEVNIIL